MQAYVGVPLEVINLSTYSSVHDGYRSVFFLQAVILGEYRKKRNLDVEREVSVKTDGKGQRNVGRGGRCRQTELISQLGQGLLLQN